MGDTVSKAQIKDTQLEGLEGNKLIISSLSIKTY